MDDLRFDRQKDLNILTPNYPCVVGAGGIGTWVSIILCQLGSKNLFVFDDDIIEEHNLNRLPYSKDSISMKKIDALKKFLEIYPTNVYAYDMKFNKFNSAVLISKPEVIFDCTDDYKSQLEIQKWTQDNSFTFYIRIGTNRHHITIENSVAEWNVENNEQNGICGVTIPQWICPQIESAVRGVQKFIFGLHKNLSYDWRETWE